MKVAKKTDALQLTEEVKTILDVIPDIIKIHQPDHTIYFYNKAAYEFYHKAPKEIIGKKCYKVLNRNRKCSYCSFSEIIKSKDKVSKEIYIPELNKVMNVCYVPIFDNTGDLKLVVERMTDVTEKKIVEKIKDSDTKKYIQILDNFPYSILIVIDNKISQANIEACRFFETEYDEIVNANIYMYFDEKYVKIIHKKLRSVLSDYVKKEIFECEYRNSEGKIFIIEFTFTFMIYEERPAVLVLAKDITKEKQDLKNASNYQRNSLQKSFPAKEYLDIERVYAPANIVSGDFYRISNVGDKEIIGILIDVRGKGVSAALNISALDVLFLQEIRESNDVLEIVKNLNKKLTEFYSENYIAVCCFKFNMENNLFEAVGAGINRFFYKPKNESMREVLIKGPFLGMFENSEFVKETISLNRGDKFFIFTDGFDFVLDDNRDIEDYMIEKDIKETKDYIYTCLEEELLETGRLRDDCAMLAIKVK